MRRICILSIISPLLLLFAFSRTLQLVHFCEQIDEKSVPRNNGSIKKWRSVKTEEWTSNVHPPHIEEGALHWLGFTTASRWWCWWRHLRRLAAQGHLLVAVKFTKIIGLVLHLLAAILMRGRRSLYTIAQISGNSPELSGSVNLVFQLLTKIGFLRFRVLLSVIFSLDLELKNN